MIMIGARNSLSVALIAVATASRSAFRHPPAARPPAIGATPTCVPPIRFAFRRCSWPS
jgi:hypothetical protein